MRDVSIKVYTVDECQALYDNGAAAIAFYRDDEEPFGRFSQWARTPFTVAGVTFPSAEHYMMYSKAKLFGDSEVADKILNTDSPERVKRLGRQVRNFNQQAWDDRKLDIVASANLAKFTQNNYLGFLLRQTHDSIIVEASPVDSIWGAGLGGDSVRRAEPRHYPGQNLLGRVLMGVRDYISKEQGK